MTLSARDKDLALGIALMFLIMLAIAATVGMEGW